MSRIGSLFTLSTLFPLILLAGSGCSVSGGPTNSSPGGTYLSLTGNWGILGYNSTGLAAPILEFTGALQSTGSSVTGTLRALDINGLLGTPCVALTQDLAATGTLDTSGNLTLTVPISGGVATIKVALSSNLHSPITQGSYQIVGGACAQGATTAFIDQYASATGTYVGTLTPLGSSSTTSATVTLTQSLTPDADGLFALSGTVVLTGACNASFSFTGGTVTGGDINSFYEPSYQGPNGILNAALLADASALGAVHVDAFAPSSCVSLQTPTTTTLSRQ
jgi:hypothetical protein